MWSFSWSSDQNYTKISGSESFTRWLIWCEPASDGKVQVRQERRESSEYVRF